jgi:maltose/moltooligosaccharide transporter
MVQLAFVQFFTWVALFAMWIYTTNGIAENVYHTTDPQSATFQDAGNWVGIMFAVYNGVSALGAFVLPVFARATSRKTVHAVCLAIGGISLVSLFFITTKQALLVPMVGVGLAWASILSMPYAILAGSLPARRMGYFMGLFNFFVVIPQICSGTLLGFANKYLFDGHPIRILVLGGVCMLVAAALTLFVTDKTERLADR